MNLFDLDILLLPARYIQIGNAVAVPVGIALGYALGLAFQGVANSSPVLTLPDNFPHRDIP